MLGAAWMFGERMRWERWLAALIGFAGVLIVVAPKLSGSGGAYTLVDAGIVAGLRSLVPHHQGPHAL